MADLTRKTVPEQINVMQASAAGAPIDVKAYDSRRWQHVDDPAFNWGTSDYKVSLDYTELFNSTVNSVDYDKLQKTLYCLERGKKLGDAIAYSVDVLQESKSKIAEQVRQNFNTEYQAVQDDITVEDIRHTSVFSTVYQSVENKYMKIAEADMEADASLLQTYKSLNNYYEQVYKTTVNNEVADMVSELNVTIKGLTTEPTINSLINISNDTIDGIILQQRNKTEDNLYKNEAPTIPQLKERFSGVMNDAMEQYTNALDDTYAFAFDGNVNVTIKKQLEEAEPAINISYDIYNYALNGDSNPQIDWGFNDEGKVVTVTGITPTEAQSIVDNSYNNFLNELKKEENARKDADTDIINYANNNFTKVFNDFDKLSEDTDTRLRVIAAKEASDIQELKLNGIFTNLSVTNPIHGSLIGHSVQADELKAGFIELKSGNTTTSIEPGKINSPLINSPKYTGNLVEVNSGNITTLSTKTSANETYNNVGDTLKSHDNTLSNHGTHLSNVDNTLSNHESRIGTAESTETNLTKRLDSLNDDITQSTQTIATVVSNAKTDIDTKLSDSISSLESARVDQVSIAQADIQSGVQEKIDAVNTAATDAESRLKAVEARVPYKFSISGSTLTITNA